VASALCALWVGFFGTGTAWAQEDAGGDSAADDSAGGDSAADDSAGGDSAADDSAGGDSAEEDPLSKYKTPFGVLAERTIGTTSRPVEFNWRRTTVQLGGQVAQPFELNSFDSLRLGGLARIPRDGRIFEFGASYVWVWDTPSTEMLALTPYRQPGRPWRVSFEGTFGLPLAEGLVTASPRWFPALELVLMGYAGLRYDWYPGSMTGKTFRERLSATFNPGLTDSEEAFLEGRRHDGMQLDPARYTPMIGLGNDIYLAQGVFVSPRVMLSVPLFALAVDSELYWWGEAVLVVGAAF
jgi:hypothetical protein